MRGEHPLESQIASLEKDLESAHRSRESAEAEAREHFSRLQETQALLKESEKRAAEYHEKWQEALSRDTGEVERLESEKAALEFRVKSDRIRLENVAEEYAYVARETGWDGRSAMLIALCAEFGLKRLKPDTEDNGAEDANGEEETPGGFDYEGIRRTIEAKCKRHAETGNAGALRMWQDLRFCFSQTSRPFLNVDRIENNIAVVVSKKGMDTNLKRELLNALNKRLQEVS